MAYINPGDLLVNLDGDQLIALGSDYCRRVPGRGDYVDDWRIIPSVSVVNTRTGNQSTERLADVKKFFI